MLENLKEWTKDIFDLKLTGGVDPYVAAGKENARVARGYHYSPWNRFTNSADRWK